MVKCMILQLFWKWSIHSKGITVISTCKQYDSMCKNILNQREKKCQAKGAVRHQNMWRYGNLSNYPTNRCVLFLSSGESKYSSKFNDARCTTCKYATKCTSCTDQNGSHGFSTSSNQQSTYGSDEANKSWSKYNVARWIYLNGTFLPQQKKLSLTHNALLLFNALDNVKCITARTTGLGAITQNGKWPISFIACRPTNNTTNSTK